MALQIKCAEIRSVMMFYRSYHFFGVMAILSFLAISVSVSGKETSPKELSIKNTKTKEKGAEEESDRMKKLKERKDMLSLENEIRAEKWEKETSAKKQKLQELELMRAAELQDLSYEESKIRAEKIRLDLELSRMKIELARKEKLLADRKLKSDNLALTIFNREQKNQWQKEVNKPITYLNEPLQGNALHLSDRVVNLEGLISYATAKSVVEKIHFYANQSSEKPIFLVIDSSPGGSVMAGYQIIKAMRSSKAPVIVLVKTYAASMAATIATMAQTSYCFSSSIILHHQIRGFNKGNLTQQRERLKLAEQWNQRIAGPVAKKMGISLEQFIKRMYENNSDGDWMEFGDKAVKLKWISRVIDKVVDQSIRKEPRPENENSIAIRLVGGRLPKLSPFDLYFLYDPEENFHYESEGK